MQYFLLFGTSSGMQIYIITLIRVIIQVRSSSQNNEINLLQFNKFLLQPTYIYDPDGHCKICQIDPLTDGNAIGWSIQKLKTRLAEMIEAIIMEISLAKLICKRF